MEVIKNEADMFAERTESKRESEPCCVYVYFRINSAKLSNDTEVTT